MHVLVRLGEPFWRSAGQRNLEIELAAPATVAELLGELCREHPALEKELASAEPSLFIGEEEATRSSVLSEGCRVHIVWAIAGG